MHVCVKSWERRRNFIPHMSVSVSVLVCECLSVCLLSHSLHSLSDILPSIHSVLIFLFLCYDFDNTDGFKFPEIHLLIILSPGTSPPSPGTCPISRDSVPISRDSVPISSNFALSPLARPHLQGLRPHLQGLHPHLQGLSPHLQRFRLHLQ